MLAKNFFPLIATWKKGCFLLFFGFPSLFFGQGTSQTSTITLDEIALEAPKLKTSRFVIPASVSSINLLPLQEFQQQLSLQEYLRSVPGVFTLNANNYAQDLRLSIR